MVEELITAIRRFLPRSLAVFALSSAAFSHPLDSYVQATLVAIAPGEIRLQINLTPGVAIAAKVLSLIDRDHDGVISTNEAAAYAQLLKHDLAARIDQRDLELTLAASNFPEPAELRTGWGIIQMEFLGKAGNLAAGAHRFTLENRHLPGISVYLFNAERPSAATIQIASQKRNETQSLGEIDFNYNPLPSSSTPVKYVMFWAVALAGIFLGAGLAARSSRRSRQAGDVRTE
jgi:hypothetical protein